MSDMWTETAFTIATQAPCAPELVRQYAKEGRIPSRLLPNGQRLFKPSAVRVVRRLKAEGLARRGRYPRSARAEASL